MYACGLRIGEAVSLRPRQVDARQGVNRIIGKGNKERLLPLPESLLLAMRQVWRTHRNPDWVFAVTGRKNHICIKSLRGAFQAAAQQQDIIACRTPAMGGHLWHCPHCDKDVYVYHGCRNRACPSCHATQTQEWLQRRQAELLPCDYFHLTATIPQGLRPLFRLHQKTFCHLLMSLTAQCIMEISANPRFLGVLPGIMAVLHTWTGKLTYHPHVHCLVTGGGVSMDHQQWIASPRCVFLPVRVLSRHLRHLFATALQRRHPELFAQVPQQVWRQEWVVYCTPWGEANKAVLEYLARYVFRIAITDRRILAMDQQTVSFRYKDRKGKRQRICRVQGAEFVGRFLPHVLPRNFHKVRYYGLWHSKRQALAQQVRQRLELQQQQPPPPPCSDDSDAAAPAEVSGQPFRPRCPHCGGGDLIHLRELPRPRCRGP
jgi:hypothetical protein